MTTVEQALEQAARALASHAAGECPWDESDGVWVNGRAKAQACADWTDDARAAIAAFLKSIAGSPTPEMVVVGRVADNDADLAAQFSVSHNIWRAMASKLADQVEDRHGG